LGQKWDTLSEPQSPLLYLFSGGWGKSGTPSRSLKGPMTIIIFNPWGLGQKWDASGSLKDPMTIIYLFPWGLGQKWDTFWSFMGHIAVRAAYI
jgi:hypothetical protein